MKTPSESYDYSKYEYYASHHHKRYKARVENMHRKLICQECGGVGGSTDVVLDYGQGPWIQCGICEGTGYLTPYLRGQWLKWKKGEYCR